MLKRIVLISYYPIIICLIVVINIFVIRLFRTLKNVGATVELGGGIGSGLSAIEGKKTEIGKTKDSWAFFASIYFIFVIIKEIIRYRKRDYSLGRSISKAAIKHSRQLTRIKL